MPAHLSEYEKRRLENIKRNKAVLTKLGLGGKRRRRTTPPLVKTVRARKKTKRKATAVKQKQLPRRTSKRLKGVKPTNYLEEKIIETHVEIKEEKRMLALKRKKLTTDDILKKSRQWLKETRTRMNTAIKSETMSSSSCPAYSFRNRAIEKWGQGVHSCLTSNTATFDWESYYISRLSTPPKMKSPLLLLQEFYNDCPWKLLCACALMST